MEQMRLQKYLAECGIASRRKAEEIIKQGRVSVNGLTVIEMGLKVSAHDIIKIDGRTVNLETKKVYIMLNKPVGVVTTAKDQFSRKTVLDFLEDINERVYPVGRLDYDTSGLLLLTNDGDFAYKLTHPKHEIEKVYMAEVRGLPDEEAIRLFKKGIRIDDYTTAPAELTIIRGNPKISIIKIIIHEGKNRQVRKMCEATGYPVINLKRTAIGKLNLGRLEEGKWRYLSREEVKWLS